MTSIFELAKAFFSIEQMTNAKLQKLCYYAKAWHLALYDENLIDEPFEAWVHGPVSPVLYDKYKDYDWDKIAEIVDKSDVPADLLKYVEQIYDAYGHLDGDDLEVVSHRELPWMEARKDKRAWESCDTIISEDTMKSFYKMEYAREYAVIK